MAGTVHGSVLISGKSGRPSCSTSSPTHSQPGSAATALGAAPFSAASNLLPKCSANAPRHAPSIDCIELSSGCSHKGVRSTPSSSYQRTLAQLGMLLRCRLQRMNSLVVPVLESAAQSTSTRGGGSTRSASCRRQPLPPAREALRMRCCVCRSQDSVEQLLLILN